MQFKPTTVGATAKPSKGVKRVRPPSLDLPQAKFRGRFQPAVVVPEPRVPHIKGVPDRGDGQRADEAFQAMVEARKAAVPATRYADWVHPDMLPGEICKLYGSLADLNQQGAIDDLTAELWRQGWSHDRIIQLGCWAASSWRRLYNDPKWLFAIRRYRHGAKRRFRATVVSVEAIVNE